jgi:hypothetical protein
MKKTITLLLLTFFVSSVFAQFTQKTGVIKKLPDGVTIEIDGVLDAAYDGANVYNVDRPFEGENPSVGAPGETHWQAMWNDTGIFIFVTVADNVWVPKYAGGTDEEWRHDKIELYFDANFDKKDGIGGGGGAGHYQVAPQPDQAKIDGTPTTWDSGAIWAYKVANPAYTLEVFIPWSMLKDKTGKVMRKHDGLGFDVNVTDRDSPDLTPGRQRMLWSNNKNPENWSNMNDAGIVTFDGLPDVTEVESITLTGGAITADNQKLQIVATVLPEDATTKDLTWSVRSGRATISSTGLLTPILDGPVVVRAEAQDDSGVRADITIQVSGQIPTMKELSLIQNGDFSQVDANNFPTHWGGWIDNVGGPTSVVEGVATLPVTSVGMDGANIVPWRYQFNQQGFKATPNVPYKLMFDAWSDAARVATVDFEDTGTNNYNRYGASPTGKGGRSEWDFNLTDKKQKFTYDVTFDQIIATTMEKLQFMVSQEVGTVYIDNVILISEADLALVPSEFPVTFNVDMTGATNFTPGTSILFMTGNFWGEWVKPGDRAADQTLTRVGETMIYSKTLNLAPGTYEYKYFIGASWDVGEWAGGENRIVVIDEPRTVNNVWGEPGDITSVRNPELVSLRVYPNPARSFFTVEASSRINRIMVTDLAGKTVYNSPVNENQVRIQNDFQSGIYIIRVFTNEGVSVRKLQVVR